MEQNDKTGKVTATLQEIAYYNMFLTEAIFELLAEKDILNGEEVKERIKNAEERDATSVSLCAVTDRTGLRTAFGY